MRGSLPPGCALPSGVPVAPLRSVKLDERVVLALRAITSRVLASRVLASRVLAGGEMPSGEERPSGGVRSGALSALWPSDLRSSP